MSSRRARIKAVSSLPVRRKNNANTKSSSTPKPQEDTGSKPDELETSTKVHVELPSSLENEQISSIINGMESDIAAYEDNFNLGVQEQSKTKTTKPETEPKSTILANALTRPLTKNFLSKSTITLHGSSLLQCNTNGDSTSKSGVKILSNVPVSLRTYSANVNNNQIREKVARRRGDDETGGVEGIVPLERDVNGFVNLLKNDIMSDSAEVQFDPVLPLPTPDKTPHNLQNSASDSEDEHMQEATAVRMEQVEHRVGGISQPSLSTHQARPKVRPLKSVASCQSALQRKMNVREDILKRDELTMYDLIFHNPTSNPIVENRDEERVIKKMLERGGGGAEVVEGEKSAEEEEEEGLEDREETMPAPQVKLGPDGQIIIDESSLVIKTKRGGRKLRAGTVHERGGSGGRYKRTPRTKSWTDAETVRFYRALTAVGTDFSIMLPLFPDRSRRDLKLKFKKEEKVNGAQIDKALAAHVNFDMESMRRQFVRERLEAEENARRERQEVRDAMRAQRHKIKLAQAQGLRYSKAARSMLEMMPTSKPSLEVGSASDILLFNSLQQYSEDTDTSSKVAQPARAPTPPRLPRLTKFASTTRSYNLPSDVDPMSVAKDAAPGSLVCFNTPDPGDASKRLLQTYVSDDNGGLSPIQLPPAMLTYVKDCMSSRSPSQPVSAESETQQHQQSSYTIINL